MILASINTFRGLLQAATLPDLARAYANREGVSLEAAEAYVADAWFNAEGPRLSPRKRTLAELLSGASAILHDAVGSVVPQSEALRRAAICKKCPMHTEGATQECGSCAVYGELRSGIHKILGVPITEIPGTETLGCDVCGCACAILVWARPAAFKKSDHPNRPAECWINGIVQ